MKTTYYLALASSVQRPASSVQRPASSVGAVAVRLVAILSLLVAQPVWAEVAEPRDEVSEEVSELVSNRSSTIDQLLSEQRALSSRVAALEAATTEPHRSNEHWFSVAIALLGVVTFIHALRLRRLK